MRDFAIFRADGGELTNGRNILSIKTVSLTINAS